ncbi:MAG TPA: glycoside hydrolase family 3 N-terminal domain-containing protein [Bryobacteraceae bacterium]|nr:glycoside hydrolase family 3 N-terminal domain-containing protein [Bryobacteraceae bacterium]
MNHSRRDFLGACAAAALGSSLLRTAQGATAGSPRFSTFDSNARQLLAQMRLEEKVGQMMQPDESYIKNLDDVVKYNLGSVLSGGDSDPKSGNDLISWTDMYDQFQERALRSRLRIPIVYGVDAVHGHNNVIGATIFPHNIGLGCTRSPELVEKAALITSKEVRATGINWAFAPCVAVPQDIRWGRTYEGFSENPDVVKLLGPAAVRGLQRASLDDPLAVLACSKHYVADGGTTFGTGGFGRHMLDQGDTRVDLATIKRVFLPGYVTTVQAGVGSIMPSYSSWNGVKCSASKELLTDLLKTQLGFDGFLISDYRAVQQIQAPSFKDQIRISINAGMDMVMIPDTYQEFFRLTMELANEGGIPMSRINDAVLRILRVKFAMGLMDRERSPLADRSLHASFGSPEHRAVARDCVRASLVLLKNDRHALPLKRGARIHLAGKSANDIGDQCGGWTVKWQGSSGEDAIGTTVLAALRKGAHVTYSADGSGAAGASVGVAVIGEKPYAEGFGDRASLPLDPKDVSVVENLKRAGIPVVVVIFSGRPLIIDPILDKADAIVAAWLPGTEGDGVADVLFGAHKPSGKLSFTWPKGSSTTLHIGEPGYETLYPFGHGLSY